MVVLIIINVFFTASSVSWARVADTAVLPMWPSPQHPGGYLTPFFFFVIRFVVIRCRFPQRVILKVGVRQVPSGKCWCCLNEGVLVVRIPKRCPGLLALKRWAWTGTSRRLAAGLRGGRNLPRGAHHHPLRRGLEVHSGRTNGRLCTNYLQVASVFTRITLTSWLLIMHSSDAGEC